MFMSERSGASDFCFLAQVFENPEISVEITLEINLQY
jgi:hypothetical protein